MEHCLRSIIICVRVYLNAFVGTSYRWIIANTIRSLGKRATTIDSGYLRRTKYRKKGAKSGAYEEGIYKRRAEFTRATLAVQILSNSNPIESRA